MCAACVAQGVAYVGGALTGLQVMAARAKTKRQRSELPELADAAAEPTDAGGATAQSEPEVELTRP